MNMGFFFADVRDSDDAVTAYPFKPERFDTDSFNRWDASQRLGMQALLDIVATLQTAEDGDGKAPQLDQRLVEAARKTLTATGIDQAVQAYTLAFPSEVLLSEELGVIDPSVVHAARNFARQELAVQLEPELLATYKATSVGSEAGTPYTFSQDEVGRRRLRNACLGLLAALPASNDVRIIRASLCVCV